MCRLLWSECCALVLVVGCLLAVGCLSWSVFVVCLFCVLFVDCCSLDVVCCVLFVGVPCSLFVVRRWLFVVFLLLRVVCCVLFVGV